MSAMPEPFLPQSVGLNDTTRRPTREIAPVCADDPSPYKRIAKGEYLARCVGQHLERVRMYGNAWKLRLDFQVLDLDENPVLCKFFHLGAGERPQIGRKSQYFRAWMLAHNGQLPRRGHTMSARLFLNKLFRVRVSDVRRRWDSFDHAPDAIYSTVSEILELCLE
ncbi:MAG: hypothetical protein WA463_16225 [Terriglobales bacterium]